MIVTAETKYSAFADVEQYLDDEGKKTLMKAAEERFKSCYELTIDEFFGVLDGNYSLLGDMSDPSVLQKYWLERFAAFVEEFSAEVNKTNLEPTPEQRLSYTGTLPMSPTESMLVFTREYFGLHSFFEAGKRTIGEYLTARKDRYNQMLTQRNYSNIQRNKLKRK